MSRTWRDDHQDRHEATSTEPYEPPPPNWRDDLTGHPWTDDVVTETGETGYTCLRHVPTQQLVHHRGRADAETLAELADMLAAHLVITEEERAAAHAGLPVRGRPTS